MNAAQNPLNVCPYWVGDILTTMSEIQPAQRWPGTSWERITDCFLRAADSTHPAGSTGGAWEVVQTVEQVAAHSHAVGGSPATAPNGILFPAWCAVASGNTGSGGERRYPLATTNSGGNKPMPIANKYTACYMWKRTGCPRRGWRHECDPKPLLPAARWYGTARRRACE